MIKLTKTQYNILEQAAAAPECCVRDFMSNMPKITQVKLTDELVDKGLVIYTYQYPSESAETEVRYLITNEGFAAIGKARGEAKVAPLSAECQEPIELSEAQEDILKKAANAQETCVWNFMSNPSKHEQEKALNGLIARGLVKFTAQFNPLKPNEKGINYLITEEGLAAAGKI